MAGAFYSGAFYSGAFYTDTDLLPVTPADTNDGAGPIRHQKDHHAKRRQAELEERLELTSSLQQAYAQIRGVLSPDAEIAVSEVVAPFVAANSDVGLPAPESIDFEALSDSVDALETILKAYLQVEHDEDESVIQIILHGLA